MITTAVAAGVTRVRPRETTRHRGHGTFYGALSGALLVIVLTGFSRTLYLRAFFNVPEIPPLVIAHGILLTAWFVGVFVQTALVRAHRVAVHRRLGWILGLVGIAVVVFSLAVTLNFVPRQRALGRDLEASIARFSSVVWTDLAALLVFPVFVSTAIVMRRRPELHKRLMVLASISIVSPAMGRMWTMVGIPRAEQDLVSLGALVMLLLSLVGYDVISSKRVHAVTAIGATFFIGLRILGGFVIAGSELGRSFVRGL